MIRIVFLGLIIYLLYKGHKFWKNVKTTLENATAGNNAGRNSQIDDVMVKDPFCEVYFPKREGFHLNHNGEDLYFCSEKCRDEFIASSS